MEGRFTEDRFVVTLRDGKSTMHRNPTEQCNLDDTDRDKRVDAFEAESMMLRGDAVACQHCIGEKWG